MARVSTYLNFPRNTEEASNTTNSSSEGCSAGRTARFGDFPATEVMIQIAEEDKNLIMAIPYAIKK